MKERAKDTRRRTKRRKGTIAQRNTLTFMLGICSPTQNMQHDDNSMTRARSSPLSNFLDDATLRYSPLSILSYPSALSSSTFIHALDSTTQRSHITIRRFRIFKKKFENSKFGFENILKILKFYSAQCVSMLRAQFHDNTPSLLQGNQQMQAVRLVVVGDATTSKIGRGSDKTTLMVCTFLSLFSL